MGRQHDTERKSKKAGHIPSDGKADEGVDGWASPRRGRLCADPGPSTGLDEQTHRLGLAAGVNGRREHVFKWVE